MSKKVIKIDLLNVPLSSSLGHLAYGDLAFTAWRELKKKQNKKERDEEE